MPRKPSWAKERPKRKIQSTATAVRRFVDELREARGLPPLRRRLRQSPPALVVYENPNK